MNKISLKSINRMKPEDFQNLYSYPITEYRAELLMQSLKKHEVYGVFIEDICIGIIEIHNGNEVGYRIADAYRNNGYASQALSQVVEFRQTPLIAYVEKANAASIKVLEHCGFLLTKEFTHTYQYTHTEDFQMKTTRKTVEELLSNSEYQYPIYACTINNVYRPLTTEVTEEDEICLYDIRNGYANLAYQHSLSLLYLEAIRRIFQPNISVKIANSLSKGIYTTIQTTISDEIVNQIERTMKQIVSDEAPITESKISREEAIAYLKTQKDAKDHKMKLYSNKEIQEIYQVKLGGTTELTYIHLLPNTKYLQQFELRRYRNGILLRFPHPSNPTRIPPYVEQALLYDAFAREDRWEKLLGISYTSDLNQATKNHDNEMIMVSEALHEKRIAQLAETIQIQKKRIILIAGPSSSGKTSFAKRLIIQLRVLGLHPLYLGTDDYFINREDLVPDENGEIDFETIDAVDVPLLTSQLNDLLKSQTVDIPRFDFIEGKKVYGERIVKIDENQPIVLEGIHGLNPSLTEGIAESEKFRIYISPLTSLNIDLHHRIPTTDVRLLRRIVRDARVRNRNATVTIEGWSSVRKGEDKWIFPYSDVADAFFNSSLIYEIAALKKFVKPLLEEIPQTHATYPEAQRLLTFLQYFEEMESDSIVSNSILREFIGGSLLAN